MRRKKWSIMLCIAMLALGGITLSGCGGKDDVAKNQTDDRNMGQTGNEAEQKKETSEQVSAEYTTLEEFFATPDGKDYYAALEEELNDEEAGMSIRVEGNTLYINSVLADVNMAELSEEDKTNVREALKEPIQQMMSAFGSVFNDVIGELKESSGLDSVTIVAMYVDINMEEVYSMEYTGN